MDDGKTIRVAGANGTARVIGVLLSCMKAHGHEFHVSRAGKSPFYEIKVDTSAMKCVNEALSPIPPLR